MPLADIFNRMQRTLWMCANDVATFRRFELGGNARQMSGDNKSMSTWLTRSFVKNDRTNSLPKTTEPAP